MKFCKSQRELSQANYTPACNYYDPNLPGKQVLTGSLAGPSPIRQQACFGLSRRFPQKISSVPGPGTYSAKKNREKAKNLIETRVVLNGQRKQAFVQNIQNSPSIPYNKFKLDQQDLQIVKQLLTSEDLNKSALSIKKKSQGYTFSKTGREFQKQKSLKQTQQPLQSITEYQIQRQPKPNLTQMRQKVKKSTERRTQIMNMINPQFIPSLELIQLITKRRTKYNPGPGSYNQFETRPVELGVSFTTTKRFSQSKITALGLGPGEYKVMDQKMKCASFSKSQRNLFNLKEETDLEHRFYIDPYSNIKKRSSLIEKGSPFGSQMARFVKIQKQPVRIEQTAKAKKAIKFQAIIEKKLKKLQVLQKKYTHQSQGLLGLSTMASSIQ